MPGHLHFDKLKLRLIKLIFDTFSLQHRNHVDNQTPKRHVQHSDTLMT